MPDIGGYRLRTAHCARRPVKRGQEGIARGVDFAPAVLAKVIADHRMVFLQELTPAIIADVGCYLG